MNGEIDSGSSLETKGLGDGNIVGLGGMIVINTNNQTARNISTNELSGDRPRTRGLLQYISGISSNGILVQIGGNQKTLDPTNTTDTVGDLVSFGFAVKLARVEELILEPDSDGPDRCLRCCLLVSQLYTERDMVQAAGDWRHSSRACRCLSRPSIFNRRFQPQHVRAPLFS